MWIVKVISHPEIRYVDGSTTAARVVVYDSKLALRLARNDFSSERDAEIFALGTMAGLRVMGEKEVSLARTTDDEPYRRAGQ